jgi:hypothetical protein
MRVLLALGLVVASVPIVSAQPATGAGAPATPEPAAASEAAAASESAATSEPATTPESGGSAEPVTASKPADEPGCDFHPYLEPSLLITLVTEVGAPSSVYIPKSAGRPLVRVAAGARVGPCRSLPVALRLGVTGYGSLIGRSGIGEYGYRKGETNIGVELEVGVPIDRFELGPRIGIERADGDSVFFTVGVRARLPGAAWVGVDAFHITRSSREPTCADLATGGCSAATSGVMAGLGASGKAGLIGSAVVAVSYLGLLWLEAHEPSD